MKPPGVVVDSGSFLVVKANISSYDAQRQATSKALKVKFSNQLLSCTG